MNWLIMLKKAFDIEYQTVLGWQEWEGIHWRQDWDLTRHSEYSGHDLRYTDPITKERFFPWIVETSGGVDRTFLNLLLDAYEEEPDPNGKDPRTVLHLHPRLAPVKVDALASFRRRTKRNLFQLPESITKTCGVIWCLSMMM